MEQTCVLAGTAYIPFAEIPRLRNMALTGRASDGSSYRSLTASSGPPTGSVSCTQAKPVDNNTPVPFGYYKSKKSPFDP